VLAAIDREDLLNDERFNSLEGLIANMAEYRAILDEAFSQFSSGELLQRLNEQDVPCARCHNYDEVLEQEQLIANDTVIHREHPLLGNMRIVKSPAKFDGQRLSPGHHSPDHGEHTREVLQEFGVDISRIDELMAAGAIS
jgi:CoA:oxalate CoA-transferase